MLRILLLALALAAGASSAAQAQAVDVVQVCGASSGVATPVGPGGRLTRDVNGQLCVTGGGGGGGGSTIVTGSLEQDVRSTQTLNAATANAAITVPVNGQGTLGFTITGLTASGATLTFEQSEDGGTTWTIVNEVNAGTGVATSTRTTDGQTRIAASGRTNIRFRVSTVGTGTITIAYSLSVREGMVALTTPLPPGGNVIGSTLSGQFNTTLPTLASGAYGPLAVDANGRQILAPTSTIGVTLADGADATEGTKADAAATNATSSWSVVALLKGIYNGLLAPTPAGTNIIGKVGIDQTTPGTTNGVQITNQVSQTTTGALQPPTAATGKITQTQVSVAATTSTQLVAANTARIAVEIQCDGTAPVGVDRTGAALTSATAAPLVIPSGSYPLYTMPIATQTAITAYTATAQVCRVTEYLR